MKRVTLVCDRCHAPLYLATTASYAFLEPMAVVRTDQDGEECADLCNDCADGLKEFWNGDWDALCARYDLDNREREEAPDA